MQPPWWGDPRDQGGCARKTRVVTLKRPGWFHSKDHGSSRATTLVVVRQPPWSFMANHHGLSPVSTTTLAKVRLEAEFVLLGAALSRPKEAITPDRSYDSSTIALKNGTRTFWPIAPCVSNGRQRKKIVVPLLGMSVNVLLSPEIDTVQPANTRLALFLGRPSIATSDVART